MAETGLTVPWHLGRSDRYPASRPHAVIKDSDGSVAGCHATEADAKKQLAALYASEEGESSMTIPAERRFTLFPVELRAKGDHLRIGGYAAVFDKPSQNLGGFVEIVNRAFFNKSRGDGWPDVMARYNHDDNMLLGTTGGNTLRLRVDETGLDYEVELPQARADIGELVGRGDVRKSSFAFRVYKNGDDWTMTEQGYPLRTLLSGQLVDVAPVNTPAYLDTSAGLRSLADKFDTAVEEVRRLAEADELRRFFIRTDNKGKPAPAPVKRLTRVEARSMIARHLADPA